MRHRALLIGAVGAGLALVTGGIWLLPGSRWRATSEERPAAPAPARSPGPAPPAARQDAPRSRSGPADNDRPPAGASANPAPRATRSQSSPTPLADAETDRSIEKRIEPKLSADLPLAPEPLAPEPPAPERKGRKPDDLFSDDQTVHALRDPPRPKSTDAPTPVAMDKLKDRQTEESPETSEALGYVGEPALSSVPNPPPDSTLVPKARPLRATPPIRTFEDPRPRDELVRDQGLRQSIEDVMRLGVAEDVAEIRAGSLLVSLTPAAMHVPSVMYNLQRLYLAYSAATEYRDEVALELRHGRHLYGWFTRDGFTQARSK